MCSCKRMYVEARGVLWKLFHRSHVLFFLEARFLIGLEPRSRPGWLASGFQGSDCFLLFSAGFISRHGHTCVSKWVMGIKLGPSWSRFRHGAGAVSLPWLPSPLFSCLYLLEALVSLTFSTLGGWAAFFSCLPPAFFPESKHTLIFRGTHICFSTQGVWSWTKVLSCSMAGNFPKAGKPDNLRDLHFCHLSRSIVCFHWQ